MRNGMPALARPHMHTSACGAIGALTQADTCLRPRCAGVAPSIEFSIITVIAGVAGTVSVAAVPLPVASTVLIRRVLVATLVRTVGTTAGGAGAVHVNAYDLSERCHLSLQLF